MVQRAQHIDQFDQIEAPFTAFIFRDEGLRFVQLGGHLLLRPPTILSGIDEQLPEFVVAR